MKLRLLMAAVCLMGFTGAALPQVGVEFKYTCAPGRFSFSYSKKEPKLWHYCYDGKHYTAKTLPTGVRAYFEKLDRDTKESTDKFHKEWDETKQRSTEYWANVDADRTARGLPTLAEQREANRRWAAEKQGWNENAPQSLPRGGGIEASGKREAEPVTPEALKAITPGTPAAALLATLGEPPGKVATGDNAES